MNKILFTVIGSTALSAVYGAHNILDYGAIPSALEIDTPTSFANTGAFLKAVQAANSSLTDRTVHIPKTDGKIYMMPILLENLKEVSFIVDGDVVASSDHINWPNHTDWQMERSKSYMSTTTHRHYGGSDFGPCISFWEIHDSDGVYFSGSGKVDGQGYWWWMRDYLVLNYANRPHLLRMDRVRNARIEGINWVNSPMYHLFLIDIDSFYIADFEIMVDVYEQKMLAQKFNNFDYKLNVPTFPLNTDGIDPSGTNITIRNVTITNYDDAVAVKPANQAYKVGKCAQNILVENCKVTYSVGMTIGSVPPNTDHACVKDVTFRNITMDTPIKAIYVKSNPGDTGDGIIENILYENFVIREPIWWGIYIGPQQQKQPDGDGPGCMLYPVINQCLTNPLVTMRNITLRNIYSTEGILPPGIIRCNESNPCTDFTFDNVIVTGWFTVFGYGYITENVIGTQINSYPSPGFVAADDFNGTTPVRDWGSELLEALEFRKQYSEYL